MSEREEQVERDEEGAPTRSTLEDESKEAIREAAEAGYTPPPRSESPEAEVPVAEEEEMPEAEEEVPAAEEEEAPLVEEETPEAEEEMPEAEEEPPAEAVPVVDLNTATPQELSRLPGIGLTLAKRIVTYREQEGPFREAAEITRVQGISNTLYETLADQITVGPVAVEEAEAALPSPEEVEVVPVGAGPEVGEAEEEGPYVIPLATEEEQPGAEPLPELEEEAPEPEEEAPEPEAPAPAPPPP
ncbi:MAG: helix-hairpin-helix domain-containing protein, partial [Anaerolineae bacterium]